MTHQRTKWQRSREVDQNVKTPLGSYFDQSRSVVPLTVDNWISTGAILRVEHEKMRRIVCSETMEEGPHWIRQIVKSKHEADSLQVIIRILGGSASGARVRMVFGREQTAKSCWVLLKDRKVVQTDFRNTEIFNSSPSGGFTLSFEVHFGEPIDVLDIGIMLLNEDRKTVYLGCEKDLKLGSCFVTFDSSASVRVCHSRNDSFGKTANKLCKGRGLEIGALHKPFDLDAHVTYLDYETTEVLRRQYRADARVDTIGQVQVVWRGNFYPFFDDNAFDFVINSHVLEHTCNPGRMIEEWLRLVRPAGILYMVIPDKRHTFDRPRRLTEIDHMIEEYSSALEVIPIEHYEDYIVNSEQKYNTEKKYIEACHDAQSSIHVHTFTADSVLEFLNALQAFFSFEICHFQSAAMHIHVALRKL